MSVLSQIVCVVHVLRAFDVLEESMVARLKLDGIDGKGTTRSGARCII